MKTWSPVPESCGMFSYSGRPLLLHEVHFFQKKSQPHHPSPPEHTEMFALPVSACSTLRIHFIFGQAKMLLDSKACTPDGYFLYFCPRKLPVFFVVVVVVIVVSLIIELGIVLFCFWIGISLLCPPRCLCCPTGFSCSCLQPISSLEEDGGEKGRLDTRTASLFRQAAVRLSAAARSARFSRHGAKSSRGSLARSHARRGLRNVLSLDMDERTGRRRCCGGVVYHRAVAVSLWLNTC